MKKSICILMCMLVSLIVSAQTQQGYVKTKGRLGSNGTNIKGQPIAGVLVQAKGHNAVVSNQSGKFSMHLKGEKYGLLKIQKEGYILMDPDMLSRQYTQSKDPLLIVMENQAQLAAERKSIERQIKSNLYTQLNRRNDEIKLLREQNKISEDKYLELQLQLNSAQEDNERIIKEMVDAYACIDFDQIDELQRQVSHLILNGDLTEAEALINSKGDIRSRVELQLERGKILAEQQKKLKKAEVVFKKDNDDIAQLCYSKYLMFKMQYQNDSAAFYLEQRAELDSTNVMWQLDAGAFLCDYKTDMEGAMEFFKRALRNAKDSADYRSIYNNMGSLCHETGHYVEAIDYFEKALSLFSEREKNNDKLIPLIYANISASYKNNNDIETAEEYAVKALGLSLELFGEQHDITGDCYNQLGRLYDIKEKHTKAKECYQKAISIFENLPNEKELELSICYNNLAGACKELKEYTSAKEYYLMALEKRKKIMGENNPRLATMYNNLGVFFLGLRDYDEALIYYNKSIELWSKSKALRHNLITAYGNLGFIYRLWGNKVKALEMFKKGEEITEEYYKRGDRDAMLFLPYIQICLSELADTSEEYKNQYMHFMDDKAVIAYVVTGKDTPAERMGLAGEYYMVEYCGWNIYSSLNVFTLSEEMTDKPKDVVLIKDDVAFPLHFENAMGAEFKLFYVTPEEKQHIQSIYDKWKKQQKNYFGIKK